MINGKGMIIKMKDIWKEADEKKINKKKLLILIIICIVALAIIITSIFYLYNKNVREWIDKNILRKEIQQNRAVTIDLKEEQIYHI